MDSSQAFKKNIRLIKLYSSSSIYVLVSLQKNSAHKLRKMDLVREKKRVEHAIDREIVLEEHLVS